MSDASFEAQTPPQTGESRRNNIMEVRLAKEDLSLTFRIDPEALDERCKMIAFLSPKGGSGKTVISSNLGKILQQCGYNVLLIDADFETKTLTNLIFPGRKVIKENLSSYYKHLVGADDSDIYAGLNGVYEGTQILSVDVSPQGKRIDILPSFYSKEQQSTLGTNIFLRENRRNNLSNVTHRLSALVGAIKSLNRYDYIIIDCAAASDDIGMAAAILAPFVVLVSEVDDVSFEALDDALRYTISLAFSSTADGSYRIKQPFIALNKDPNLRPGERTSRRSAFHCKYIPDIHKRFGRQSFLVPDVIEDVEFEYQLHRLWRRISEWSTSPEETFTAAACQRVIQLERIRQQQVERYWNADLQYRKRNVIFGLTILLVLSSWIGTYGYLQPSLDAITLAFSGIGLFVSAVLLYGVWEYFEKMIRALKNELFIDPATREEHRLIVKELSQLMMSRGDREESPGYPPGQNGNEREARSEVRSQKSEVRSL
ncbi:MAG: hypothetical protein A3F84_18095 [Candidatus Handelsmanbacteria bacterium RIFCSPLOWO2_12_FULL_64_10]|uniref:AAA domain-containing protein n=1 Tax=Handelsmanbacteria sp. (strain RIFCSPLOWO2_12_FULL_64_10) TaxID=1817868 RepID=A0A1F6CCU3_HANXR|nr:MAG: hypothetical protein A3F84_18095 [Candidatus Handelsmanbacteria bacterium RIFCSPLOWO2_12_FULL_64_10]